jgi:amino acid adenylation domain-containing protein
MSAPSPALIHLPVEHWAGLTPEAPAVTGAHEALSYQALYERAWGLARLLQEAGFTRGARGAVLLESSVECVTAMLGVLRADGCYLPLGVNNPPSRLAQVLADAAPEALMTSSAMLPFLAAAMEESGLKPRIVAVMDRALPDELPAALSAARELVCLRDVESAAMPKPQKNIGRDLAYLLYTSGSTGRPKGVMVRHENAAAYLDWFVKRLDVTPGDRLSNHASPTFDISVQDIFGALLAGASVHPLETQGEKAFPGPFIRKRGITVWNSVPSVISMMVKTRQLAAGAFPELRAAIFAGEPLLPGMAQAWLDALPRCALYNFYGPTETTIVVAHHHVTSVTPGKSVPIGLPTGPSECMILNADNRPAPPGTPGRLFIRGAQVTAGYWRDPYKTAKAFMVNPLNPELGDMVYDTGDLAQADESGVISYMGRADNQVKIRGQRVELEDVEAAFGSQPGVLETAALLSPGEADPLLLIAVSGPAKDAEHAEEALLEAVSKLLPTYMIPHRVLFFAELARNANGKVDRKAVAEAVRERLGQA